MDRKFGWNPQVGDRVQGVGGSTPQGTGVFGTIVAEKRWGYVVRWDNGGRSTHQSYGLRKEER